MAKHPVLNELLEDSSIRAIEREAAIRKELPIYQLQVPDAEGLRKEAYRWAHTLFAETKYEDSRTEPIQHRDRLVLQHPERLRVRTYYASGYTEFRHLDRAYAGETDVADIREADALVKAFGSKHDLWPVMDHKELQADAIRYIKSQGSARDGSETDIITNNSIVGYKRLTDGIPWVGPGSRISALIEGKDVVGFNRYWREVMNKRSPMTALAPIESAVEAMVNELSSRLDNATIERGDIVLDHAEFGYYAAGKRRLQRFLQPVYVFIYRIPNAFTTAAYVDVRPAHDKQLEALGREPMQPIRQSVRNPAR